MLKATIIKTGVFLTLGIILSNIVHCEEYIETIEEIPIKSRTYAKVFYAKGGLMSADYTANYPEGKVEIKASSLYFGATNGIGGGVGYYITGFFKIELEGELSLARNQLTKDPFIDSIYGEGINDFRVSINSYAVAPLLMVKPYIGVGLGLAKVSFKTFQGSNYPWVMQMNLGTQFDLKEIAAIETNVSPYINGKMILIAPRFNDITQATLKIIEEAVKNKNNKGIDVAAIRKITPYIGWQVEIGVIFPFQSPF